MSGIDHDGLRLPLGDGQHIFACGATGSGKTTTMRRVLAARTITQKAALLILDQKGDQEDVEQMSRLAGAAGVPFVLIDPQDNWQAALERIYSAVRSGWTEGRW